MNSRRKAIKSIFSGAVAAGTGGLLWGIAAENTTASEMALRPPGAQKGDGFLKACIKCGQCAEACPYDTLVLADADNAKGLGSPYFEPRKIPCYMCTNYPCTEACPSGALDVNLLKGDEGEPSINNAEMGLAVIHKETCIAFEGIQCDVCYRACPLINEAITLEAETNTFTNKHANLKPVVNSDKCTGCGVCEHVCVVKKSAIFVLPREKATGALGDHYMKSWDEDHELESSPQEEEDMDKDVESAIEYLNDDSGLFD